MEAVRCEIDSGGCERDEFNEALLSGPMRIQSTHSFEDRGFDAYFTCREAIEALIRLEGDRLPKTIWEPAAGDGAIVKALRASGRIVHASDIHDYGLPGCYIVDYLSAPAPPAGWADGIVTNPPYSLALEFVAKALDEVPYVALLVRSNWYFENSLDGRRSPWLDRNPPTRIWLPQPRLPMMHRHGWKGKKSRSNAPHCWVVWELGEAPTLPQRAYWHGLLGIEKPSRSRRKTV